VGLLYGDSLGWVLDLFVRAHYLAPFLILLVCGIGLPLPEEVPLVGSGLLLYRGEVEFIPIVLVCSMAILMGDSLIYWLGHHYGTRILRVRWVARILHPERFAILERRFQDHGNWAVFTCRFLPGIRVPGYFLAGTLGMTYLRFLILDLAGIVISVPTSIWLGKIFGRTIDELQGRVQGLHQILGFGMVVLALILFMRSRVRARERQVRDAEDRGTGGNKSL
jgi:membrane protein DedA with SNARE-associated domain